MILLIDNYDSFVYNLRRYFQILGHSVVVLRNDDTEIDASASQAAAIVLSPGPKSPTEAGRCLELITKWSGKKPILGICLGHQAICQAFGGSIVRARRPLHGHATPMQILSKSRILAGIPTGTKFARYHSLVADPQTIPKSLRVVATSLEEEVMAVEHSRHLTFGLQFHPESVLSSCGFQVLANFLQLAGLSTPNELPTNDWSEAERRSAACSKPSDSHASDFEENGPHVVLPIPKCV